MSRYSEYKQYICSSLHGVMSEEHIVTLKQRITYGVDTPDELHKAYKDLYELKNREPLMTFEVWYREKRLKNLLD